MADFDLTQTDAQVQSILNDAQDAQGAGAQTTLTTEYIMLKDTSGNYHKILKSSFTEACRNVLAGLLVNNDKGTTISQIAAIASGDFGSVTPDNLASFLGEAGHITKTNSAQTDVDFTTFLKTANPGLYFNTFTNIPSYLISLISGYVYVEVTYQGTANWFFRISPGTTSGPMIFIIYNRDGQLIKSISSIERTNVPMT